MFYKKVINQNIIDINELDRKNKYLESRINVLSDTINKLIKMVDKKLMNNCSHDFIYTFENLEKKCSKCGDKETYSNIDEFIKAIKSDYKKLNK